MKRLACSLLSILILLTISCEIGLGESVDTDPPSLTIDTDIVDKIIRDDFVLRGTYSDDGKIDGISVVLKRTDKTGSSSTFYGTIHEEGKNRGSGTWTIDIPAKTKGIQDGAYQADVTIIDSTKRTTVQSTVFTIDNTPPLIILTRPSTSLASSSFDTYGRKFTIEGAAAEANNIGRLEIQLYTDQACTIKAADEPIVLTNVPISIEVEAANYDTDASKYIYEGITQKFELDVPTNGDGKEFYYKLFAYDGAIRYLEKNATQTDDDKKGNRAEYFFLQKDIYEDIGQYYTTTELYSIMSGTYTGDDSSRSAGAPDSNTVKNDLLDAVKYQRTVGKFSLNPKNNPTYTLTGRSPLASDTEDSYNDADNELLNGGQLIIEVSPGLDGHLLKEDTIKIYVTQCTFNEGKPVYKTPVEITNYEKKTSGSAYKFITTINREEGFEIGGTYKVVVEGKDVKGNDISSVGTNPYGFKLVSTGRPPALTITQPEDATTYANEKQTFKGEVEVESGVPVVSIYKGSVSAENKVETIEFTADQGTKEGSGYVYNFTYDDKGYDGTTKTQKLIFEAEAEGIKSAQPERIVVYDMNIPTISITKPSTAKKFSDNIGTEVSGAYINGIAEFTVMLNDKGGSGLDTEKNKPKWEIFDALNKTTPIASGLIAETTGETIIIDTTDSKYDEKTIIFRVTAWDEAGNKKTTESDDDKYTFIIDQSTDRPYIAKDSNYTKIDFTQSNINTYFAQTGTKVGNVEKGSTLKFKVYEDDGEARLYIAKKKITVNKAEGSSNYTVTDWVSKPTQLPREELGIQDTPNKLVTVSSYTFPANDEDCGFYEYAIIAEDVFNSNKQEVIGPFIVRVTQDKPKIEVTADKEYANQDLDVNNTIKITPSEGDYKLYRQVLKYSERAEYDDSINNSSDTATDDYKHYKFIKTLSDSELEYTDTIKIGAYNDDIIVYYKITDGIGNESIQKSVVLNLDEDPPTVDIKSPTSDKIGKKALTEAIQFSAKLFDEKSKVKYIYYKFTDNSNPTKAGSRVYINTNETDLENGFIRKSATDGTYAFDEIGFVSGSTNQAEKLCEGKWYLHIYAEDEAGNKSVPETREFDIDIDVPTATVSLPKSIFNFEDLSTTDNVTTGSFNAVVTASDTQGLSSVVIKATNTKDSTKSKEISYTNKSGTWNEKFIFGPDADSSKDNYLAEGVYNITVISKDKVNKETTSPAVQVTIDYTLPNVGTLKLNDELYNNSNWYETKTLKVDVDITDDISKVSTVSVKTYKYTSSGYVADKITPLSNDDGNTWTGMAQFSTEGGNLKFEIIARDSANNTFTTPSKTLKIDTSAPVLKSLFYKIEGGSLQASGGTVYITSNKKITVYGSYYDVHSGVINLDFNTDVTGTVSKTYYKSVDGISDLTKDNLETIFVASGKTTISSEIHYWMAEFTPTVVEGATVDLIITGENTAGVQTKLEPAFNITKDTTPPEVVRENTTFKTNSAANVVYEKSGKYYVNNKNQTFTLKGIATDNIALDKVELKAKDKGGSDVTISSKKVGSPATWEFSTIDLSSLDTKASLYVILTDRAGNTNTVDNQKVEIVFDTTAPVGKHLEDGSGKDIYFRVGNFPNDDNSTSDTGTAKWDEATDNDVGGKYSAITYNNSTQMNIRGLYDDGDILGTADVSGVKAIYYKVYNGTEYEEIAEKFESLKNKTNADEINASLVTLVKANGTQIKPLYGSDIEEKRVFYKDTDSSNTTSGSSTLGGKLTSEGYLGTNAAGKAINKHWATIKSNFDQRLTGFIEGTNYLVMVTEDNVGNTAVDKAILVSGDIYNNFRLNVDVTAPAVDCYESDRVDLYSNTADVATGKLKDGKIVLTGTITDGVLAGVSSLTIKVGSKQTVLEIDDTSAEEKLVITKDNVKADPVAMSSAIEDSDTDKLTTANSSNVRSWKVTLPGSYFTGLTGTQRIKAVTKDKAKNVSEEIEIATVIVDADDPVITLNKPDNIVGTNTVNGKITLSGTINDANLTEESGDTKTLELYYTTKTGADTDTSYTTGTDASHAWRKYDAKNHAASWKFADIDTSTLVLKVEGGNTTYISDETTVYFVVRATDKAGNIGYSNKLPLIVDQDTDRPELTFRNLTLANNTSAMSSTTKILARTRELWGTIKDDDGIVYVKVSENGTDWSEDCYENGTWTYTASKDGVVDLWFQVKDTEGGIFTSKAGLTSLDVKTPKLVDANSNKYGYRSGSGVTAGNANVLDSKVYLRVDTIRPKIEKSKIYYTTDSTAVASITSSNIANQFGDTIPEGWSKLSDLGSSYLGGTEKRLLWLLYAATDDNGILSKDESFKKGDESITPTNVEGITFTPTTNNTICPRIVKFDLNGKPTGTYNLSLKVQDQAGSWCDPEEFQIQIDNTAPLVTYTTFDIDGKDAYGSLAVEFKGTTRDPEAQQISNLYFAVSKDTTTPSSFTDMTAYLTETGITSWYINFECNSATEVASHNNSNNPTNNYHAEKLNNYLDSLYVGTPSNETAEKDLYIWVYAKDVLGNASIPAARRINVIPQADKPAVKFIFPKETATSANTILGGTITITGETSIQSDEVEKVYLQIDPDYDGSDFNDSTWEQDLNTLIGTQEVGYEVTGINVKTSPAAATTTEKRGILVDGTTSWNISINTLGEFKSKVEGDNKVNRKVAIRAYAVSKTNKLLSEQKLVSFEVDPNRPSFSGFEDSNDIILENSDASASKKYKENDWVSGVWYLKGSVQHAAGIKTLTLKYDTEETGITLIANNSVKTENLTGNLEGAAIEERDDGKGWDFKIPVSKASGAAKTDFTLTATDARATGAQDSSRTFIVQYDNNAPVNFTARTTNGDLADNTVAKFIQSNQTFELSGSIKDGDGESGLERIAFYFTRDVSTTTYFIDPMIAKQKSSGTAPDLYRNNYRALSTDSTLSTNIKSEDGLYWVEVSGASYSNEKLSATIPETYASNIRVGGICKIDNIVYRIESVSGNQIGLSGAPVNTTNLTVKFALAQIIDNTYTESLKNQSTYTGLFDSSKNDREELMSYGDGDQMREGIEASGMSYSWQAAINSLNIYDGPVTVHFVYFDKAGNSDSKTFKAQFCNNAPRIASVTVGSDYNGNEIVGDIASELATYYVNQKEVNGAYKAGSLTSETLEIGTNTTAFKKLKGKSQIDVEVVGGNGDLYYSYNIGQSKGASTNTVIGEGPKIGVGHQDNSIVSEYTYNTGLPNQYIKDDAAWVTARTNTIDLPVSYFEKYLGKDGQAIANNDETHPVTWFQYTIWDETDGLEKFSTEKPSQNVTVQIALNVQVNDTVDPQVVIDRFYWKGKSDNSLYNNDPAQGHIELENDWKESDFYKGLTEAPTSGEFDADPKVSGKITFRGSAWDNTRIDELWAKVSYPNGSNSVIHSLANPYDTTTNDSLDGFQKIAVYEKKGGNGTDKNDMVWRVASAAIGDGWTFSIDTEIVNNVKKYKGKIDDDGHIVYWTMNFDTQKLSTVCANDVTVDIRAVDSKDRYTSSVVTPGTDSTGNKAPAEYSNIPSYRMDVVPYITGIKTTKRNKSGLKDSNIRSASGKYSILYSSTGDTDFITVKGFNLNPGQYDVRIVNEATKTTATVAPGTSATTGTGILVTSTKNHTVNNQSVTTSSLGYTEFWASNKISKSGYLEVFTNGVRSLNNINNNDSYGTTKNSSNLQINADNAEISDYANAYNREPDYNTTKNVQLTDDRYLRMFDMKATAIKNGYYPNMIMDGNDPVFAYVDLNGNNKSSSIRGYIKSAYQTQRTKFSGIDASFTDITYLEGAISSDQMVMAKDEAGKYIHATVYNYNNATMDVIYNDYAEDHTWNNSTYTDGWAGGTGYSGYNGVYSYDGNNNAIALEGTNFGEGTLIGRYQNLRMIAKGYSTTPTGASIYMAYYDDNTQNKDIIFRTFKIGTNSSWTNTLNNGTRGTTGAYSNLADSDTSGRVTVGSKASKYLDMGVTSKESDKNIVVIVYYNMDEACLKLKYSDVAVDGSDTTPEITWQDANVTFPSYVGTDVSMVIDSNNGIHIAALDSSDADLVYMYMPSYDSETLKVSRVDQASSVGNWTRIALKGDVPYIAYYNSTEAGSRDPIKLAYFADTNSTVADAAEEDIQGCDSNGYTTGKWEYMTIPAITPPQGSDSKFKQVNLDFDKSNNPVVGYLGTTLEFGKELLE